MRKLIAIIATTVLIAACGSDSDESPTTTNEGVTTTQGSVQSELDEEIEERQDIEEQIEDEVESEVVEEIND